MIQFGLNISGFQDPGNTMVHESIRGVICTVPSKTLQERVRREDCVFVASPAHLASTVPASRSMVSQQRLHASRKQSAFGRAGRRLTEPPSFSGRPGRRRASLNNVSRRRRRLTSGSTAGLNRHQAVASGVRRGSIKNTMARRVNVRAEAVGDDPHVVRLAAQPMVYGSFAGGGEILR